MKASHLILSTFLLFSVPVSCARQVETVVASDTRATASQATWANVNNIHFTDGFSLFNSGVAKLPLGKPIEVSANIAFSGDIESIKQAVVTFENIGQGIQIDYDQFIQFNENQKQAQFKFFITLTAPVPNGETRLFTVKVSDNSPGDNKYLTPYSQRQTVIEDKSFASQDSTPPVSSESTTEPSTESSTELSTESSTESTTETNTKPSSEESTKPTTPPSTESDTESSTKPTSDPNTKPSSEESTKSTTEQSTKPSSESTPEPSTPQSTGASSTTTIESTTASSSTTNKKEGDSQSQKGSKVDQSSSGQSITIDNSKTHTLKTLNRSNMSSRYRILPKTGEHTSDRLLVFGGILSFLSAALILIKRKN